MATLVVRRAVAVVSRDDLGVASAGGSVVRVTFRALLPTHWTSAVIASFALRVAKRAVLLLTTAAAKCRPRATAVRFARNDVRILAAGRAVVREAFRAFFPANGPPSVVNRLAHRITKRAALLVPFAARRQRLRG